MPSPFDETDNAGDVPSAVAELPPKPVYAGPPPGTQAPMTPSDQGQPPPRKQPIPWNIPDRSQSANAPGINELQNFNNQIMDWATQAGSAREMNARLAATRQATQAATEFVRRKEVERLVRSGVPLEDAEFKSRVKYNTATGGQLNALRPVKPPSAMEIGGVPGVSFGQGQWKAMPRPVAPKPTQEQKDAVSYHGQMVKEGVKLHDAINSQLGRRAQAVADTSLDAATKKNEVAKIDAHLAELQKQYSDQQALTVKSRAAVANPNVRAATDDPKVTSQQHYNELKSGDIYIGKDGKRYRKP